VAKISSLIIFHKHFYQKQKQNKTDKSNENFVIAFVEFFVQSFIAFVRKYHCNYKSNDKKNRKNELTFCKHGV
jgi:hypothetical protein